jgi:hypothetical protein
MGSTPTFELGHVAQSVANRCHTSHTPVTAAPEPVRFDGRSRLNPESLSEFSVPLLPNTHVLQGCLAEFTGSSALSVQGGDGKLDEFDTLKL